MLVTSSRFEYVCTVLNSDETRRSTVANAPPGRSPGATPDLGSKVTMPDGTSRTMTAISALAVAFEGVYLTEKSSELTLPSPLVSARLGVSMNVWAPPSLSNVTAVSAAVLVSRSESCTVTVTTDESEYHALSRLMVPFAFAEDSAVINPRDAAMARAIKATSPSNE